MSAEKPGLVARTVNRQWVLARRPTAIPKPEDFALIEAQIAQPGPGDVLMRTHYLAMDPAIRNVLGQGGAYAVPLPLGQPIRGMVLGEVVMSNGPALAVGDFAWGFGTWSDFVCAPAAGLVRVPASDDLALHLHYYGTIGLTASYGLFDIAQMRQGQSVLVPRPLESGFLRIDGLVRFRHRIEPRHTSVLLRPRNVSRETMPA